MSWRRKSFDLLPALSIRGRPLRASLRTLIISWMFGIAWFSCVNGSQLTIFGRMLGMTDEDFGIFTAIPFAATFAQLFGAIAIERTGVRRRAYLVYGAVNRGLWAVVAGIPLLLGAGRPAVIVFLCVYGLSGMLLELSIPPWTTWMGDLVPRRIRGRYFAMRSMAALPVRIAVMIAAGWLLDVVRDPHKPGMSMSDQPWQLWTICGLFTLGAGLGVVNVLLFRRLREIASPALVDGTGGVAVPAWKALPKMPAEALVVMWRACRDRVFRRHALYGATIAFAVAVGGQFWMINALENVGMSRLGANVVFHVCPSLAALLTSRLWGRLVDRWGCRPVLILATVAVVFAPAPWFLIPPASPDHLLRAYLLGGLACVFGGTMWYGINLAQTNVALGFSETSQRSRHVAAFWAIVAVGGFLGGWAGGHIAETFAFLLQNPVRVGPFLWKSYHVNFLASSAMRAAAVLWLIGLPDPAGRPVRELFRQVRLNVYDTVAAGLLWPVRAMGARRRSRDGDSPTGGEETTDSTNDTNRTNQER